MDCQGASARLRALLQRAHSGGRPRRRRANRRLPFAQLAQGAAQGGRALGSDPRDQHELPGHLRARARDRLHRAAGWRDARRRGRPGGRQGRALRDDRARARRRMSSYDITIATYGEYPNLFSDDVILREALEGLGAAVRVAVWNDPAVDWSASETTLVRSTWDYPEDVIAFERWIERVDAVSTLYNPLSAIRWNLHKRYLLELQNRGVATVPTIFLTRGDRGDVRALARARGWERVVIKPAVSAASVRTGCFAADASEAQAHADALLRERDVMIQPFVAEVESEGELALMFVGSEFTHAARKLPFHGFPERREYEEELADAPSALVDRAKDVLAAAAQPALAYARVDFVPTRRGPLLMELELIEPSLFF